MKTIYNKSISLFLILGFTGLSSEGFSQNNKLTRQERKEVRKTELQMNFHILDSLLNKRTFVLQADYLQNRYGDRISVLSTLNFIRVNKSTGVLQTGSTSSFGYNGVGGVTAEGTIVSWEVTKNEKRQSYVVRFGIATNIGHYDVLLTVSANTRASATITGLYPGRLTWDGRLVTLDNSSVFKGHNTI